MPIDYSTYPKDWKLRSRFVRFYRARNRCEWCGVRGGAWGFREPSGGAFQECSGPDEVIAMGLKPLHIVLTVAHVFDMTHSNGSLLNLAALCQRCHLNHDRQHHTENAWKTRRAKKNNLELFA